MDSPTERIDDSAGLPKSGRFYDGDTSSTGSSDVRLPTYQPISHFGVSPRAEPLTLTDCYEALQTAIRKARLIGFEIARTQKRFPAIRSTKAIALEGEPRDLDRLLHQFNGTIPYILNVDDVTRPFPELSSRSTTAVDGPFRRLLFAQDRFKQGNEQLKRGLLRIEKHFVQNVIEPLKQNFIRETAPAFSTLKTQVQRCTQDVQTAGDARSAEFLVAAKDVKGMAISHGQYCLCVDIQCSVVALAGNNETYCQD